MTAELWPQHGVSSELWVCAQALQDVLMLHLTISVPHKLCERCCCQGAWLGEERKGEETAAFVLFGFFCLYWNPIYQPCFWRKEDLPHLPSSQFWAAEVAVVSAKMYAGLCQEFCRFQSTFQLLGRIQRWDDCAMSIYLRMLFGRKENMGGIEKN